METDKPTIDVTKKYVRLIERRADGFVEFEFAIGEPEIYAEMLLPGEAYEAFCKSNEVIHLGPREEQAEGDGSEWGWNLHQATHERFR